MLDMDGLFKKKLSISFTAISHRSATVQCYVITNMQSIYIKLLNIITLYYNYFFAKLNDII